MEKLTSEKTVWEKDNTFVVACMIYLAVLLLLIIVRGLFESRLFSLNEEMTQILFSVCSQVLVMFLVPIVAMKIFSKQPLKNTATDFGFGRTSWKVVGIAFLLGVLLYIFNILVASVSQALLSVFGLRLPSGGTPFVGVEGLLISLLLIAVLPGIAEETSHRGLLLRSFSQKMGVGRAVLFSALIFGFMHLSIRQFFYATILGYAIALGVLVTRSIWTGVIIHFTNNALDTYLSFASKNNWVLGSFYDFIAQPFGFVLFIVLACCAYALVMKIIHSFGRSEYKKNEKTLLAFFFKDNPQFVKQFVDNREPLSLDQMSSNIEHYVNSLTKREQILYYIDSHGSKTAMTALEKTLLFGILFLGAVITAMTFVWGAFL